MPNIIIIYYMARFKRRSSHVPNLMQMSEMTQPRWQCCASQVWHQSAFMLLIVFSRVNLTLVFYLLQFSQRLRFFYTNKDKLEQEKFDKEIRGCSGCKTTTY